MSVDESAAVRSLATGFPIPMRGNEMQIEAEMYSDPNLFPIPMRGNENVRAWWLGPRPPGVSDPHEG